MITLTIDGREVRVEEGSTIMEAAEKAGIHIPSMCYREGHDALTSCMVCVVEVEGSAALEPSCAAKAVSGMIVRTDTERVRVSRKTAVELLLSEHAGDCTAPCRRVCPQNIDIPEMIKKIRQKDLTGAFAIVSGKTGCSEAGCMTLCERACRRGRIDGAVSIKSLVEFVRKQNFSCKSDDPVGHKKRREVSILRNIREEELAAFLSNASKEERSPDPGENGYDPEQAFSESMRCLDCDCGKQYECKLRDIADLFGAKQSAFSGERLEFTRKTLRKYVFENGKCVKCGICAAICEEKNIKYSFAFFGRGFSSRIGVPLERYENEELNAVIDEIVKNCPTGALTLNKGRNQ